eukprot:Amastigsp_a174635_1107.p5 type:complete len:107 gc:universal Amastigsp_a174635_1107:279-599(+)
MRKRGVQEFHGPNSLESEGRCRAVHTHTSRLCACHIKPRPNPHLRRAREFLLERFIEPGTRSSEYTHAASATHEPHTKRYVLECSSVVRSSRGSWTHKAQRPRVPS